MTDPLDHLIHVLRSPAAPNELDGMEAAIDALHQAMIENLEPMMSPTSTPPLSPVGRRRRMPVATLIAAGVLGFAGVAAAGPGGLLSDNGSEAPAASVPSDPFISTGTTVPATSTPDTSTPDTSASETTTPTTDSDHDGTGTTSAPLSDDTTETSTADTTADSLVDDPATAFDETECAEGNHGKTVSSVAHAVEPGPGHGAAVSEAAHSSCGKQNSDDGAPDEDDEDDSTTTTLGAVAPIDDSDVAGSSTSPGRSDHAANAPGATAKANGSATANSNANKSKHDK